MAWESLHGQTVRSNPNEQVFDYFLRIDDSSVTVGYGSQKQTFILDFTKYRYKITWARISGYEGKFYKAAVGSTNTIEIPSDVYTHEMHDSINISRLVFLDTNTFSEELASFAFLRESKNSTPTIAITLPTANQTLHENSTLTLAGNTTDTDIDNIVTVKYQIDSSTVRNLHSAVSDGVTAINFSKSLTYKDGMLYDGATAVTTKLDKDVPHIISMWAEDGKGGKSSIVTRTFFVVPNRPPSLTINPIAAQSELINSNVINVTGTVTDLDNNDVTATFSINGAEEQVIFEGAARNFTFNILLNDLKVGANTIIVKVVDTYKAVTTKTLTINKTHNATPINEAVALYKISAPTGTAKSILLWITRTLGPLQITPEISFTDVGEPENFVPLTLTNTGTLNGMREDEYAYQGSEDKTNVVLKIKYNRNDATSLDAIKQISGVLF